jgi:hypothetical protein
MHRNTRGHPGRQASSFERIFGGYIAAHERLAASLRPQDAATHHPCDRADVVATAILQIVRQALQEWLYRGDVDLTTVRAQVENILRDEFHDIERQVAGERGQP